ncbi:IS66 family insertion sequence element accessory protein TnpB, partial [Algiphilus sp. W345]
ERRIWLYRQPTDMRRSFDGLSAMVRRHLGREPSDGAWYAFINRRRTQIKVLAFESGGYCVWSKRLEQGQFGTADQADDPMSPAQFLALLEGLDWRLVRRRKRYEKPRKSVAAGASAW